MNDSYSCHISSAMHVFHSVDFGIQLDFLLSLTTVHITSYTLLLMVINSEEVSY